MHLRPMLLLFFLTSSPLFAAALPQHATAARAVSVNVESLANTTLQTTSVVLVSYTVYTTVFETSDATSPAPGTQATLSENSSSAPGTGVSDISTGTVLPVSLSVPVTSSIMASDSTQGDSLVSSITPSPVFGPSTSIDPITPSNTDTITNIDNSISLPSTSTPSPDPTDSQPKSDPPSPPPATEPDLSSTVAPPYTFLNTTTSSLPSNSTTTDPSLPTSSLNAQCQIHPTAAICLGPPGNRFYCCNSANPRCNPVLVDGGFDCADKSLGDLADTWIRPTVTMVLQ